MGTTPWVERFLNLLFPRRCAGCGRPGAVWCAACDRDLQRFSGRLCLRCGLPLSSPAGCAGCKDLALSLPVRSYARYRGPLVRALLQLKYRPNRALAGTMADWLAEIVRREDWEPSLVAAVPLGRDRLRLRGYNQAALIGAGLAERLQVAMIEGALQRSRDTRSQVGLDAAARRANVAGAFQAQACSVSGQTVCLVDDLCTTGATLSACAQALRQAGAQRVFGLTVGRA